MAIVRWEPFREMLGLQDRVNRMMQDLWRWDRPAADVQAGAWSPAVDIYETGSDIVVKAELPEVDKKDIKISIESNTLTLQGERRVEKEIKEEDYHRIERSYGSFSRSFTLPVTVDQEKVQADYKDGVLRITLPKKPEHKPKQIAVNVA
ncbi:MAG: Hsp20/alpha crystallin family protein [Acidobacteriota bacterium]